MKPLAKMIWHGSIVISISIFIAVIITHAFQPGDAIAGIIGIISGISITQIWLNFFGGDQCIQDLINHWW
jgi:hypothetical protein